MFAGSEIGGRRAATMYTLIETCKLNGVEPLHYLRDVLERLPSTKMRDLDELLPWKWKPRPCVDVEAALANSQHLGP